jgi:DNA polymerase bacteriophage-type
LPKNKNLPQRWGFFVENTVKLWLDTETFSPENITSGTHRYAEPAEIMLLAWAVDDGPVQVEDLTNNSLPAMPSELFCRALDDADTIGIHNSHFDRTLVRHAWGFDIPVDKIDDTMVRAFAHGLPGALGQLCEIYNIDMAEAKDASGKNLIHLFCKPIPFCTPFKRADFNSKAEYDAFLQRAKSRWPGRATKETHPKQWAAFCKYAGSDITAMRAIDKFIPRWNSKGREREIWTLDQKINDRGFLVDMELANAAITTVEEHQETLAAVTQDKTDGAVQRATQRDAMLDHLLDVHNIRLPDMKKSTLERLLLRDDVMEPVKDLLRLRLDSSASATSKYKALLKSVSSDSRLRGTLQYSGAPRTMRWSGRIFQPQNLMRPTMKWKDISVAIDDIKSGAAPMIYENPILVCANAIRGCIVAPENKKLVITDLSNIEGRVLAWLAGEEWKLQAFRDYDAGTGPDLYIKAYASAFNIPIENVTKYQRQIGKVMELGLGFGGGVAAFLTFAAAYGLNLEELADAALPNIPVDILAEAKAWWEESCRRKQTYKLSERVFIACDSLKRLWRRAHPATCALWKRLENAMTQVIQTGKSVTVGRVTVGKANKWVYIELPPGHRVCYPGAAMREGKITYMGVNAYTRRFERLGTYGGKLAENITQACARDVLAHNLHRIEDAGYEVVLTVHDEVITEAPDLPEFNADHLSSLLSFNEPWAEGLPLSSAGFEDYRYHKED